MKGFHCESARYSLLGNRDNNEDRSLIIDLPHATLIAVADGMGGHPMGEAAAQILTDICKHQLEKSSNAIPEPKQFVKELLHTAHLEIISFGDNQEPPIKPRTTAVVCLIQRGLAYWAHVGDSRLYLIRNGLICTRTKDHSYIQRLKSKGLISESQGKSHPHRNYVTRCLGGKPALPKVSVGTPYPLEVGDTLLLCSDGFWGQMDTKLTIETLSNEKIPLDESLEKLTHMAEEMARPESDNVTAAALRWLPKEQDDLNQNFANSVLGSERKQPSPEDEIDSAIDTLREAIDNFDLENI